MFWAVRTRQMGRCLDVVRYQLLKPGTRLGSATLHCQRANSNTQPSSQTTKCNWSKEGRISKINRYWKDKNYYYHIRTTAHVAVGIIPRATPELLAARVISLPKPRNDDATKTYNTLLHNKSKSLHSVQNDVEWLCTIKMIVASGCVLRLAKLERKLFVEWRNPLGPPKLADDDADDRLTSRLKKLQNTSTAW